MHLLEEVRYISGKSHQQQPRSWNTLGKGTGTLLCIDDSPLPFKVITLLISYNSSSLIDRTGEQFT